MASRKAQYGGAFRSITTNAIAALTPGKPILMGDVSFAAGTVIDVNVIGDITGNLTGNVTGNVAGGNFVGDLCSASRIVSSLGASVPFMEVDTNTQGNRIFGLPITPISSDEAVTKTYVDSVSTAGTTWKNSVVASTVANLSSTYIGTPTFTLTSTVNEVLTFDGISPLLGERTLIKNQSVSSQNGIYEVTDTGSVGTPWILTRANDYDSSAEIAAGDTVFVEQGTTLANRTYVMNNYTFATLDTDPMTWALSNTVTSPLTTKGDLFIFAASNTRLPVGSNGQVLTVDGATPEGVRWVIPPSVDHGGLAGLTDDDHLQYVTLGGRPGDSLAIDNITGQTTASVSNVAGITLDGSVADVATIGRGLSSLSVINGAGAAYMIDQDLQKTATPQWTNSVLATYSDALPTNRSELQFTRSRGTNIAPTNVLAGDTLGAVVYRGCTVPCSPYPAAEIRSVATTNFASIGNSESASLIFSTANLGLMGDCLTMTPDKIIQIHSTDLSSGPGTGALQCAGGIYAGAASSLATLSVGNSIFTGTNNLFIDTTDATTVTAPVIFNGGVLISKSLYLQQMGIPPDDGLQKTVGVHDEFTVNLTVTGGSVPVVINVRVFRWGNFVCLQFPTFTVATTGVPTYLIASGVPLGNSIPTITVNTTTSADTTIAGRMIAQVKYDMSINQIQFHDALGVGGSLPTSEIITFDGFAFTYTKLI